MHRHHILPKRLGGTDDEENLTPPISLELHAAFHKDLYEHYGMLEDYIAWKALEGRISGEEARLMAAKAGQDRSEKYKESRKSCGEYLKKGRSKASEAKGGKSASKALVKWQQENREKFLAMVSRIGKEATQRKLIPHEYKGVIYPSKKELQKLLGVHNTIFYKMVEKGEIIPRKDLKINKLEGK